MRHLVHTCLIVVLLITVTRADPPRYWSQSIIVERNSTDTAHEIDLVHVDQRNILIGGLHVTNKPARADSPGAVLLIDGHQDPDGTFWPTVELQVQKERGNEWTTIGSSGSNSPISQLQIYSSTSVIGLRVNLDPFKAYLGKFRFGRIVLKSGDEALFKLDDLKPPDEHKDK